MVKVPSIKHKLTVILLMTNLASSLKKLNKRSLWDLLGIVQVIIIALSECDINVRNP